MRRDLVLLSGTFFLLIGTPVFAQSVTDERSSQATNVWLTGSEPIQELSSVRRTPNTQPTTASQPVTNQPMQTTSPVGSQQAPGITWGGGTLYAGGTLATFYDDNVFAAHANARSDTAFVARPELSWSTQGQQYTFAVDGFVEGRDYVRFSSENQINGRVGAGWTVMPDDSTQIVGSLRYIHGHLDRGSSDTVIPLPGGISALLDTAFAHPVAYDQGIQSLALNKRYGNWWSSVGAAGLEIQYQNPTIGGAAPFGGTLIDLAYANGAIASLNGRIGYVVAPLVSVFVEAVGNSRNFDVDYFSSNGYRAVGGLLFEQGPSSRLKGEIWAGFMNQQYSGITMQTVTSWTYGLNTSLAINDQLTAVLEGHREAKEAALSLAVLPSGAVGASGIACRTVGGAVCVSAIETEVGARLDYRILPNVVVGGGATYLELDYQGFSSFGRVDRTVSPLASIKYFPIANVIVGFDYRNVAFGSSGGTAAPPFTNVSALTYRKNVYLLSVNAKW
jgi:Putative beta-barrel porin 2